jgi:hypothetical protein
VKRRAFIRLIGGAVAAWPLVARGQQPTKIPTIGLLGGNASHWSAWTAAFTKRMHELSWVEGRLGDTAADGAAGADGRERGAAGALPPIRVAAFVEPCFAARPAQWP